MTNAFEDGLNNYMGRGSVGVPNDGDMLQWNALDGIWVPIAIPVQQGNVLVADTLLNNSQILSVIEGDRNQPVVTPTPPSGYAIWPIDFTLLVHIPTTKYTVTNFVQMFLETQSADQTAPGFPIIVGTASMFSNHSENQLVSSTAYTDSNVAGVAEVDGLPLVIGITADNISGGAAENWWSVRVRYTLIPTTQFGTAR